MTTARASAERLGVTIVTKGYFDPTERNVSWRTSTPGRYAGAVRSVTYAAFEDMMCLLESRENASKAEMAVVVLYVAMARKLSNFAWVNGLDTLSIVSRL